MNDKVKYVATGVWGADAKRIRKDSDFEKEEKLYWLFAWTSYDAHGGMLDLVDKFHTVGDAIAAFDAQGFGWGHIVTIHGDQYMVIADYYERWEKGKIYCGWERPKLDANGSPQFSGG